MRFPLKAILLLGICLSFSFAWGQDEPGSTPPAPAGHAGQTTSVDVSSPEANAGQLSEGGPVRQLGAANFITSNFGLMHWGPFVLGSTTLFQTYQRGTGTSESLTSLRTNLLAGHTFGRNHLVLQYSPKVTLLNGQLIRNLSDQDSSVDTYFLLGRRMRLSLSDHFQIFNTNNLVEQASFFSSDTLTSTSVQQAFLQGPTPSRYLMNSAQASLSFLLSPRTRINVSPGFTYSRASGLATPLVSDIYGATAELEHALTATKSMGVFYSYQDIRVVDGSGLFVTPYDNLGMSYSQQLTPTWGVTGSFSAFKEGLPGGARWSGNANLNTSKIAGKSTIALALYRGQGIAGVITNHTANRVDLLYHYSLTRRTRFELGSGYVVFAGVKGLYGTANLEWDMRQNLSWYANYGYKDQTGDGIQIGTFRGNFIIVGLSWHPRRAAH